MNDFLVMYDIFNLTGGIAGEGYDLAILSMGDISSNWSCPRAVPGE
ncbi:hypothetical protein ACFLY4_03040 [Chloroflexota bacterium]